MRGSSRAVSSSESQSARLSRIPSNLAMTDGNLDTANGDAS